jgi:hypothetical protein
MIDLSRQELIYLRPISQGERGERPGSALNCQYILQRAVSLPHQGKLPRSRLQIGPRAVDHSRLKQNVDVFELAFRVLRSEIGSD